MKYSEAKIGQKIKNTGSGIEVTITGLVQSKFQITVPSLGDIIFPVEKLEEWEPVNNTFLGQIISDKQANRMLSLCHKRDWNYGKTYESFYAFMETVSEEERQDIIFRLSKDVK